MYVLLLLLMSVLKDNHMSLFNKRNFSLLHTPANNTTAHNGNLQFETVLFYLWCIRHITPTLSYFRKKHL